MSEGPESYRGVPVSRWLRQYWQDDEAFWWRSGVQAVQSSIQSPVNREQLRVKLLEIVMSVYFDSEADDALDQANIISELLVNTVIGAFA